MGKIQSMKVRIGARANRHLIEIADYIRPRDAQASVRVRERIQETFVMIGEFPFIGHEGKARGTRELSIVGLPFIVVYRVHQSAVFILGVHHCAQER